MLKTDTGTIRDTYQEMERDRNKEEERCDLAERSWTSEASLQINQARINREWINEGKRNLRQFVYYCLLCVSVPEGRVLGKEFNGLK